MKNIRWLFLASFFSILQGPVCAGPPFQTDDPDPVEYQHWEFYVAGNYSHNPGGSQGTGQFEMNYGAFPEVHLHIIFNGAFNAPDGEPVESGAGDMEVGTKIRLFRSDDNSVHVAVYPTVELPTGDASKGLGSGQFQFYLPLWAQKTWGPWTSFAGGGYWVSPGTGNQDWIFLGWALQREMSKFLSLGGELTFKTPAVLGEQDVLGGNIGFILNWDEHDHFLMSVGRDLVDPVNDLQGYASYQLTL